MWHGFPDEMPTGVCACGSLFLLVLLLAVIHVLVGQYVLQHEHGVLLTVPVGALQLGEHSPDLRGVVRNVYLCLIGFQDRVLGAPRLCPVGLTLVFLRGLTDDLLDAACAMMRRFPAMRLSFISSGIQISSSRIFENSP